MLRFKLALQIIRLEEPNFFRNNSCLKLVTKVKILTTKRTVEDSYLVTSMMLSCTASIEVVPLIFHCCIKFV